MVNNHVHIGGIYVRCDDCLMFGTPMTGETQCGNCGSLNTMEYRPPCCWRPGTVTTATTAEYVVSNVASGFAVAALRKSYDAGNEITIHSLGIKIKKPTEG